MECDSENSNYSDSDEDLGLLKKALLVDLPKDFNPNKIPENGEEYLQQVMYEAKKCPAFVVSPVKLKNIKPAMQVIVNEQCMQAPKSMLPSMAWQDNTIEDFTKLRKAIFRNIQPHSRSRTFSTSLKELIDTESPKLSIVGGLSQEDKIKALETILQQLNKINPGESIDRRKGMWVYSLLCTLETPLFPDTCHILRELARKCSQIRANLMEFACEQEYVPLNLLICVIARYFRQLDLADE